MSEKAKYVKGKASTTYAVLGLGYGARGVPARHRPALRDLDEAGAERYDFVRPFQDLIMWRKGGGPSLFIRVMR